MSQLQSITNTTTSTSTITNTTTTITITTTTTTTTITTTTTTTKICVVVVKVERYDMIVQSRYLDTLQQIQNCKYSTSIMVTTSGAKPKLIEQADIL